MKETKIEIPAGCEVERIETQDGHVVVTFKEKERKLPKSWEEFCDMFPVKHGEYHIMEDSSLYPFRLGESFERNKSKDITTLQDLATAEAVLALCKLIQLRNAYNGDWVPDWNNQNERKYIIIFSKDTIEKSCSTCTSVIPLYFKSEELRDEFLRNFRPLIEKLKPLYGIKEGGEE